MIFLARKTLEFYGVADAPVSAPLPVSKPVADPVVPEQDTKPVEANVEPAKGTTDWVTDENMSKEETLDKFESLNPESALDVADVFDEDTLLKLTLGTLRDMVVEQGITTASKSRKMDKTELVRLLQTEAAETDSTETEPQSDDDDDEYVTEEDVRQANAEQLAEWLQMLGVKKIPGDVDEQREMVLNLLAD